ncbi:hypothetical protein [Blastochloris viridis]|nr:hypothetical protein [Blastochloris viridis]
MAAILGGAVSGVWQDQLPSLKAETVKWWCDFDMHYTAASNLSEEATDLLIKRHIPEGMAKHAEAYVHYKKLADCGLAEGYLGVGLAYCHGYSVEKRPDIGRKYLRMAAAENKEYAIIAEQDRFCSGPAPALPSSRRP